MYIAGFCFTNLDEYKHEEWPVEFVAIPHIGDRVEAASGKSLRVIAITHKAAQAGAIYTGLSQMRPGTPFIRIELHK